ncbi:MAG: hypothetical protein EBU90_26420, partial [Proteobacteria bacterium]|nr:hypothetical protein [Pseudomonadota bacterium]
NDIIVFSGGSGHGARANVISVNATGSIINVAYVASQTKTYPLGGMGYRSTDLPSLSVNSSNVQATGASLYVPGILGEGATFSVVADRIGAVTTIDITNPGEDYISTPSVSLKIQDIVVSNVNILNAPQKGDVAYQGTSINTATYTSTVNSASLLAPDANSELSLYNLRVFNYNSLPDPTKPIKIGVGKNINLIMANTAYNENYNSNGVRIYGDGSAKANASFLNGLVISQGQYLTSQGQPSSFDVLQSQNYNNFTYQITVEKEIAKYRDVLLSLLHPTGMKVLGRYALKSNNAMSYHGLEALYQGYPISYYTGYLATSAQILADFTNKSNNIIRINNLAGSDISTFIFPNTSYIAITPQHGPNVFSDVISVNVASNTITIGSNTWLTYANVALITGNSGSNVINITSLTGAYDIINNGNYSNTTYPLMDIVYAGDTVLVANNTSKSVSSVDYINGKIYLTSNLSANANSYLAVNRTFETTNVRIFGPIGQQYIPELITEDGRTLTTENGYTILLG